MSLLDVNGLRFNYGDGLLFQDADLRLFKGEHVGLVGINGVGKTTLLNMLASELSPDQGEIRWHPNIRVGYLDQHLKLDKKQTIRTYLYDVFADDFAKEMKMESLFESIKDSPPSGHETILHRASELQEQLIESDFYAFKSKIGNVLSGLGIPLDRLDDNLGILSGGMRAKVILAKLLLEEPDVLLLDEPTNFLDTMHVDWLTKFLTGYKNAFILVSHNTDFLKSVSNVIICLENQKLTRYKGNYDFFVKERGVREDHYQKSYVKQQQWIKKTETFIDKNIVRASTTSRAQSRRKALDKVERLAKPTQVKPIKLKFPFAGQSGIDVLAVKNLAIGYQKPLLPPFTFDITKNQKIVITGPNGVGKTTLLKTILNQLPSIDGTFRIGEGVIISYFPQEEDFPADMTPFSVVHAEYPTMIEKHIRQALSACGIGRDLVLKKISELSGGERTKVRLCLLTLRKSNFLILDEPTNHLDLQAKEALHQALEAYSGTVLLVSHERSFYKKASDFEISL